MFQILKQDGFTVIHLTDGSLLEEAATFINSGKANGINLNYIKNWPADLEVLRDLTSIKCLSINDYPNSWSYDYSAIHSMRSLEKLSIYTSDKKEIDFSVWPKLSSVALMWRPKAKSLFACTQLRNLFLGRYTGKNMLELSNLTSLKYLRINTGAVVSLEGLKNLVALEELLLMQATKLEDISDIAELKHLKRLRIDNCKRVQNIGVIKAMGIPALEITGTTPS